MGTLATKSTTAFDQYAGEYDRWFDEHEPIYRAEVNALQQLLPRTGLGLEVGVGTGRFSSPLGIGIGVEPSRNMAHIARSRNIAVCLAPGEHLPFAEGQFDFALLVTVVCFVEDVLQLLREVGRVTKVGGKVIIAFIDRESALGQVYESRKGGDKFYNEAHFYSTSEMMALLQRAGLGELHFCQTLAGLPDGSVTAYPVHAGYGAGAFVAISATKLNSTGAAV